MEAIGKIDNRVHLAKVISKKEVAQETNEFTFELERVMSYEPGQYIWVELPNMHVPDSRGNRRAFSLTSIPSEGTTVTIVFHSSKAGFNESLRALNIGDELNIIGPFGDAYCLPDDHNTPLVLLAGGLGVTPFLSLVRYSANINSPRSVQLITTNKPKERVCFAEEMESYSRSSKSIRVKNLDRILENKDIEELGDLSNSLIYVCGSQGFVDHVHELFKLRDVFDHQFHYEYFYPLKVLDQELAQLFIDGKPRVEATEPAYTRQRAALIYELVNASATHTVVTDLNGRILFANQAAQDITGFSLSEMLGNTPRLWGGLMSKEFYKDLWATKFRGEVFSGEIINRRKNGDIYVASAHISPIKNENQEVVGFIGSEEDITTIRKAEERALESEKRFIQLTEKIPEVYWITELLPVEKVAYVNPTFEKLWGLPRATLYENPRAWTRHIHPEDQKRVIDAFDLFLKNESVLNIEFRINRPDSQELIIYIQMEQVLDENGKIVRIVGVARDVTKERTIDKEKTEFVTFASHQFKTPITAIRWNLESLLAGKYGVLAPKQKEVLSGIFTMNSRIDELISNMLNVSRIEQGVFLIEPIPTDFVQICEEVLLEAGPYIEKKKHTLIKNFDKNLPKVPADTKLLRIIFQNFVSNAIKYTHEGGRVTVSLKVNCDEIVFSVASNGDPIPEVDQPKIFQKMFRASNAPEQDPGGTGLGLYIVKQIIDNGGGRAEFISKPGEDTVFFASFPLSGMVKREGTRSLF